MYPNADYTRRRPTKHLQGARGGDRGGRGNKARLGVTAAGGGYKAAATEPVVVRVWVCVCVSKANRWFVLSVCLSTEWTIKFSSPLTGRSTSLALLLLD